MLKEPCPTCNSPYLGAACPCESGAKPFPLRCECGKPASQIYSDDLGEWPVCKDCLALIEDEFSPLPLPNFNLDLEPDAEEPKAAPSTQLPFGLTERQYQIALLANDHTNSQIAEQLCLCKSTIKTHLRKIFAKLGIHSRYEIPHLLNLPPGSQSGVQRPPSPPSLALPPQTMPAPSTTDNHASPKVTITIEGKLSALRDIITLLQNDQPPKDGRHPDSPNESG